MAHITDNRIHNLSFGSLAQIKPSTTISNGHRQPIFGQLTFFIQKIPTNATELLVYGYHTTDSISYRKQNLGEMK